LGLEAVDLLLSRLEGGLGFIARGAALAQIRVGLLLALHGAGPALQQVLVAGRFLYREGQGGFGVFDFGFCLLDLRLLLVDRRCDPLQIGLVLCDLGLRLLQRHLVFPIIEPRHHRTGFHRLVVADEHLRDVTGDAGRDGDLVSLQIGVVRGFKKTSDRPPMPAVEPDAGQDDERQTE
jgi:hypothetical protein